MDIVVNQTDPQHKDDTKHQHNSRDLKLSELFQIQALQDQVSNQSSLIHLNDSQFEVEAEEEQRLFSQINEMNRDIDEDQSWKSHNQVEVQVILGSTAALTAGFVSWILRGGALLASMMSTIPLLNRFDPLPVLNSRGKEAEKTADNESDEKEKSEARVDEMFNRTTERDIP